MSLLRPLIFSAIMGLLVWFVWWRLVRRTGLRGRARIAATVAILATVAPMAYVSFTSAGGPPRVTGAFAWPVYLGWSLFGLTFVGLLLVDLVHLVIWLGRQTGRVVGRAPAPMDPSRRQALARISGGVVTTAVIGQVGVGLTQALGEPEIVDVPVRLPTLGAGLHGFRLVQLTDIHVGGTIGRAFIADLVRRTNTLGADLIALTGDFVDGSVDELRDAIAPLADLRAPHGVYFVTGNHEYYSGADAWIAHLTSLGIRVLRNERVEITRGGATFDLAGIDDHSAAKFARGHGPDLEKALAGRDRSRPVVLLAHQPRQVRAAAPYGVDLQLSGHTHGGQVWPWHYLVSIQQGGLVAGRYQIENTQLYVSRGPSYWGPPIRVGAPPEITRVILEGAAA